MVKINQHLLTSLIAIMLLASCNNTNHDKEVNLKEKEIELLKKEIELTEMQTAIDSISSAVTKKSNPQSTIKTEKIISNSTVKEELSRKKSTLINLIGEHKLSLISGVMGANTQVDYYIENGKWIASGSSDMSGMRESYDIELSKEYFKTPFKEYGLSFFLQKSPKDYFPIVDNLKPNSTFIDNYLYFYAKDFGTSLPLTYVDIVKVYADVVVIRYNTKTNEFVMSLFYGDCCDNSSYIFKKTSP